MVNGERCVGLQRCEGLQSCLYSVCGAMFACEGNDDVPRSLGAIPGRVKVAADCQTASLT